MTYLLLSFLLRRAEKIEWRHLPLPINVLERLMILSAPHEFFQA